jgi:hypothetical protein
VKHKGILTGDSGRAGNKGGETVVVTFSRCGIESVTGPSEGEVGSWFCGADEKTTRSVT